MGKVRLMALVVDPDNPTELMNIFIDECLYWETNKKRRFVYHHTNGKEYFGVQLLDDFDESEIIYSMGVRRLDHSNFVNTNYVTEYIKNRGELKFVNSLKVASVAKAHGMLIKDILRQKSNRGI